MIGPTNGKNQLTFGSDPVQDTDSGSLFHSPQHMQNRECCLVIITTYIIANFLYCLVY